MRKIRQTKQHVLRRKPRQPARVAAAPVIDSPLRRQVVAFLDWSQVRYSVATVSKRQSALETFLSWCAERDIQQA